MAGTESQLECAVTADDATGAVLTRAPPGEESFHVWVTNATTRPLEWYEEPAFWIVVGSVIAAAAIAGGVGYALTPPERQWVFTAQLSLP